MTDNGRPDPKDEDRVPFGELSGRRYAELSPVELRKLLGWLERRQVRPDIAARVRVELQRRAARVAQAAP